MCNKHRSPAVREKKFYLNPPKSEGAMRGKIEPCSHKVELFWLTGPHVKPNFPGLWPKTSWVVSHYSPHGCQVATTLQSKHSLGTRCTFPSRPPSSPAHFAPRPFPLAHTKLYDAGLKVGFREPHFPQKFAALRFCSIWTVPFSRNRAACSPGSGRKYGGDGEKGIKAETCGFPAWSRELSWCVCVCVCVVGIFPPLLCWYS